MTTREDIVAEARRWLGTRWQHQAMLRGVGTDCIGLVAGVAHALGIVDARPEIRPPAYRGYGRQPDPAILLAACAEYLDPVPAGAERPGDVLLMRFLRDPQHLAILSSADHIVHAYAQARRVVENRIDAIWRGRICGAWAFRGID